MTKQEKVLLIIERLKRVYPDAKIALNFENPFQLLIATILAAQSTDVGVNQATPELFKQHE
jgi:endonuclease-3